MKTKIVVLSSAALLLFTGCTNHIIYNKQYIEPELKTGLNKVKNTDVYIQKHKPLIIKKHPNSFRGMATTVNVDLESINSNVLKEFLQQYFKNVKFTDTFKKDGLYIDSKLYDYNYAYGFSDGNEVEEFVKVKVFYNGKKILDKTYKIKHDITALSLHINLNSLLEENFHKTLLRLYETQFKPDLIKALEKANQG